MKFHGFGEGIRNAAVVCGGEMEQAVIQEVEGDEGEFEGFPEDIEERRDNPCPQARKKEL